MYASKPTLIYGLIDPRDNRLRYIGKSVKGIKRAIDHVAHARMPGPKRRVVAWVASILAAGHIPEIFEIETLPPGGDWIEAEQFWIGYFRMVGVDLCNLTLGGEGLTGYRYSPEQLAKKTVHRGKDHYRYGKGMPPQVQQALLAGAQKFLADPFRKESWRRSLREGPHIPSATANLMATKRDPEKYRLAQEKAQATRRTPAVRTLIGAKSRESWLRNREHIIAAQNAGKGREFRYKQSQNKRREYESKPDHPFRIASAARRKLSDGDLELIRVRLASGEKQASIAESFGVDTSTISDVKTGVRR